MSAAAFSKTLREKVSEVISKRILQTKKDADDQHRTVVNKKIHVMEISAEILQDSRVLSLNVTKDTYDKTAFDLESNKKVFQEIKNEILHRTNNVKKYIHSAKENSKQYEDLTLKKGNAFIYYIDNKKDKLVLITRNFNTMKTRVNTVIKKITKTSVDVGHTAGFLGTDNSDNALQTSAVSGARMRDAIDVTFSKGHISSDSRAILNKLNLEFHEKLKDAHITYSATFKKEVSLANNKLGAAIDMVFVIPQNAQLNQNVLGTIENDLLKSFQNYIYTGKGSKPVRDIISNQMSDLFLGKKKPKAYKSIAKAKGKVKIKAKKAKVNNIETHNANIKVAPLQNTKGRFTSIASLQSLLEPLVTKYVKANMDSASYFKTDTGNFTSGVEINSINRTGSTGININYKYEDSRYGSFETGGRHHRSGREPTTIINSAVRMAAAELVGKKFGINPVRSNA